MEAASDLADCFVCEVLQNVSLYTARISLTGVSPENIVVMNPFSGEEGARHGTVESRCRAK